MAGIDMSDSRNAALPVPKWHLDEEALTPVLILEVLRHAAWHYFPLLAPDAAPQNQSANA
jgi:hypothetical protein